MHIVGTEGCDLAFGTAIYSKYTVQYNESIDVFNMYCIGTVCNHLCTWKSLLTKCKYTPADITDLYIMEHKNGHYFSYFKCSFYPFYSSKVCVT